MAGEQHFQIGVKGLARNAQGEVLMVYIPSWEGNPAYWDLPGGRMNPGETFLDTLGRELREEIGTSYVGNPKQLMAVLTPITIPVAGERVPLTLVIYEVQLPEDVAIVLDPESGETDYAWFDPAEAAENLAIKFSPDFCDMVRALQ